MEENNVLTETTEVLSDLEITRIGPAKNRIMLVLLPEDAKEKRDVLAIVSGITVPLGHQVVYVSVDNNDETVAKLTRLVEMLQAEPVPDKEPIGKKAGFRFSKKVDDHIEYLTQKIIYLLAYDSAADVSLKAFAHSNIRRAYFVSPNVEDKTLDKLTKFAQTEILAPEQDEVFGNKKLKKLSRNIPSHVTTKKISHNFDNKESLIALRDWLLGKREANYTDKVMWLIIVIAAFIGVLVGALLGYAGQGMGIGIFVGLVIALIRKKI